MYELIHCGVSIIRANKLLLQLKFHHCCSNYKWWHYCHNYPLSLLVCDFGTNIIGLMSYDYHNILKSHLALNNVSLGNSSHGKCSKITNTFTFLFLDKTMVFRAGIHKMLVRMANREDPDQTASSEAVLIRVCAVCLGICGRQLMFQILEPIFN